MSEISLLSRRSLLKASSFLAAAVATAPVAAIAAPSVPEVLTTLLTEYASAAEAVRASNARWTLAKRERETALERAGLWFEWPGGKFRMLGERGSAMHPEYALNLLRQEAAKCVAASDDAETAAEVSADYQRAIRQVRRLRRRYDIVAAGTDYDAALDAETASYHRFVSARKALCAYRPECMAEVAALIRCISEVGPYPGTQNGVTVRDLADMLDASGVAA